MDKTVKVTNINKYKRVFYGELAFNTQEFCNNLKYFFVADNLGQAMQLCR